MSNGILELAETYLRRGWQPVPVPYKSKAPVDNAWQTRTITLGDVKQYFPGIIDQNIGIALGKASGGLVDIDLDCPEAIGLARIFLPATEARFGRVSKPNSHWLYTSDLCDTEEIAKVGALDPIKDAKGKTVMIAELRTGGGGKGAQTVFPGSVHPEGEPIVWEAKGDPAHVGGAALKRAFYQLCGAALLVRHYPGLGARHEFALSLGGFLARAGWDEQAIGDYMTTIARMAGATDWREHGKTAAGAAPLLAAGKKVRGWPSLVDALGERVAEKFADWAGISSAPPSAATAATTVTNDSLARSKEGVPHSNLENVLTMLRTEPDLQDLVREDLMAHRTILQHPIPGRSGGGDPPREFTDQDTIAVQTLLQQRGLSKVGRTTVEDAVKLIANEAGFDPARDYLESLGWDSVPRVDTLFPVYFGSEDTPYTRKISRYFILSMVARIFFPGCQADYMVILEGPQGRLKSSACRVLGGQWFSGTLPDITTGKEARAHLRGLWLIEVPELHAFSRAKVTLLKSFISDPVDRFRESYGHRDMDYRRRCIFIGTTNETDYLRDQTGNRRFWPIKCGKIDLDALRRDRDQLFGEAGYLVARGERSWPSPEEEETLIESEQEQRREVDIWEPYLQDWFELGMPGAPIREPRRFFIYEAASLSNLKLRPDQMRREDANRIVTILKRLGCIRSARVAAGQFWLPPPFEED